MKLLIQNGQIFDGEKLQSSDILLEDGAVVALAPGLNAVGARVVDAQDCVVSPGFTDLHVHLRQPGQESKETIATGTAAAAAGGYTTVCSMPNLNPVPDSIDHLWQQLDAIEKDAVVRVLPYGAVSVGEKGEQLADLAGTAEDVCGYSDDGRGVQSEAMMAQAMRHTQAVGKFIAAHCEVDELIPADAVTVQENSAFAKAHSYTGVSNRSEWQEVERNIALARKTGCHIHICHTSTAESFALVRAAKAEGLPVTCEVTPHNLLLCCDDISEDNGRFKMNPPLRTAADRDAAVQALLDGTAESIATDHAPHTQEQKEDTFAHAMNGVVGLETAFASLYTGLVQKGVIPLEMLLQRMTTGPRSVLGEAPNSIHVGEPADLVVLDMHTEKEVNPKTFKTKGRSTPFAGMRLSGWPVLTVLGDDIVFEA